jgi:adenylylsulfate kinase-like enzyme
MLIYITGISGSGKTTLAKALQTKISHSVVIDGDEIRETVNRDLGFCLEDKRENIRRHNAIIQVLYDQGVTVIAALMASIVDERARILTYCKESLLIQLTTPESVCAARDPKRFYATNTPVNLFYKPLQNPHLLIDTSVVTVDEAVELILFAYLKRKISSGAA